MSSQLPEIAQAFLNPKIYPDKTTKVEMMQTQMSFIFLTGKYVYKLKKPVNLGYLDYTTLEKRLYFCNQEVTLNSRLCPDTYLGVIPVKCGPKGITLKGEGEIIDYAVKMLYLPQDRMLNVLLDRNRVIPDMMVQVAQKMAAFHAVAATNPTISAYGSIQALQINADENVSQTEKYVGKLITARQFERLKEYTNCLIREKADLFRQRQASGKVKDCHGDLHTQHICFTDGICIYDCIEFIDRFRYCDVASEIAFLAMDLDHYGRADLSSVFTDAYIESSRDHQIPEIFKFYKCYRAYVRGKVSCFKFDDPYITESEKQQTLETARGYFELAESYTRTRPLLLITAGLVGSGKSTLAQTIARRLGLTIISSDIVRKQLASIPLNEHHFDEMESGIYSTEFSRRTYDTLFSEAKNILLRGKPVILDASFIKSAERQKAAQLANEAGADLAIVECTLDEANTQIRLTQRLRNGSVSDGRWEIYEPQKKKFEPITEVPDNRHFLIDSARPLSDQITRLIESLEG